MIIASCICCSITIIAIVIPIINLYSPKPYASPPVYNNNQSKFVLMNNDQKMTLKKLLATICQLSFSPMTSLVTRSGPAFIATSDFNKDGHLDLAVTHSSNSTTSVLLGNGRGNFSQFVFSNGPFASPNTIALGDINNDQNIDILVVNSRIQDVSIFLGQGNGSFIQQTPLDIGADTSSLGLALGDLNRDNNSDLIVSDSIQYNLLIFFGIGDGTFDQTLNLYTGNLSRPYSVTTADLNGDNFLDLLVTNVGTNNVGVFLADGTGNFSEQVTYPTDASPFRLITADFNRDGFIDAATTNFGGNSVSILLGNGDGTFAPQINISTGINSTSFGLFSGDFNNDTIPDLVVANPNLNNIAVFLGRGDGSFDQALTYSTGDGSSPDDVAVGDFNEDGRLDIVSANFETQSIGFFFNLCV